MNVEAGEPRLCSRLREALTPSSRVICEGEGSFDREAVTCMYRFQEARRPKVLVHPAGVADVGATLRIARAEGERVAVRNGGHSPVAHGLAPVTIDLSSHRRVTIVRPSESGGAHAADVEAGAVWGDVYAALEGSGLAAVGGSCAGVGVAGLMTAGGISFFSRQRGLAADNVMQYTLVLPNGTVAVWSREGAPRLHAALTSGRTTLGVMWRLRLRLFADESGPAFGVIEAQVTHSALRQLLAAYRANLQAVEGVRKWTLVLGVGSSRATGPEERAKASSSKQSNATITFVYAGSLSEARRSGHELGLFRRVAHATAAAEAVSLGRPRSRGLNSSAARARIRSAAFLEPVGALQMSSKYNTSQAVMWWRSAAVDLMDDESWERAVLGRPTGKQTCVLQAEPLGGAIDESSRWPHAPAAHLLSYICVTIALSAKGRPWHRRAPSSPTLSGDDDEQLSQSLELAIRSLRGRRGVYAGYASAGDTPTDMHGASRLAQLSAAQGEIDGAAAVFGHVGAQLSTLPTRQARPLPWWQRREQQPAAAGAGSGLPLDLVTGGTSGVGLAVVERLVSAGHAVLVATHSPSKCAALAERARATPGRVLCLSADLADRDGASTLAAAAAAAVRSSGSGGCLRSVLLSASPGAADFDPREDAPLSRLLRVHFLAHRQLLHCLLRRANMWCDAGARAVVVGSGASMMATRTGVRQALAGAPFAEAAPAHVGAAARERGSPSNYFVDGTSGQLYAAVKLLEELMVLELRELLTSSAPTPALPRVVLTARSPKGTVLTNTSRAFVAWSKLALVSAAAAAAPIVEALLEERPREGGLRPPATAPPWALELFNARRSVDLFMAACLAPERVPAALVRWRPDPLGSPSASMPASEAASRRLARLHSPAAARSARSAGLLLPDRCTASLVEYHAALTAWFTGVTPRSGFASLLAALSMSPNVELVDPRGASHDRAGVVAMLQSRRGAESAGSTHTPDLASVRIHSATSTRANLSFDEVQHIERGANSKVCVVSTRATCDADADAASGVAWVRLEEALRGCKRPAGPEQRRP